MKFGNLFMIMVVGLFTVSLTSSAESLQDKQNREKALTGKSHKHALEDAAKKCGKDIGMEVNWDSFAGKYDGGHKEGSAAGYCVTVMDGVCNVCEKGADAKAAVAGKVTKVHCSYKEGVTTKGFPTDGLKLNGTTLEATYDWKTGNIQDGTKSFLMGKL